MANHARRIRNAKTDIACMDIAGLIMFIAEILFATAKNHVQIATPIADIAKIRKNQMVHLAAPIMIAQADIVYMTFVGHHHIIAEIAIVIAESRVQAVLMIAAVVLSPKNQLVHPAALMRNARQGIVITALARKSAKQTENHAVVEMNARAGIACMASAVPRQHTAGIINAIMERRALHVQPIAAVAFKPRNKFQSKKR